MSDIQYLIDESDYIRVKIIKEELRRYLDRLKYYGELITPQMLEKHVDSLDNINSVYEPCSDCIGLVNNIHVCGKSS